MDESPGVAGRWVVLALLLLRVRLARWASSPRLARSALSPRLVRCALSPRLALPACWLGSPGHPTDEKRPVPVEGPAVHHCVRP
ncbi:hypothetical protein ACTXPC_03015, partial [Brachybacterium alimentarium]|uniref:hypothetical protein n=1 Tax=Brachybacterium alimentarium TaxID=47845 RepID=UPI003FCF97CF